jgi:UDP-N-acetylmuramoylalanine--D-glutamate ligase
MNYSAKQVLVLGLGESGLAMANWLQACGARICVADTRAAPARLAQLQQQCPDARFVGGPFAGNHLPPSLLDSIDFVAVSPGLMPDGELADLIPAAAQAGIPLWGEIELFAQALADLREARGYAPKVIAITGTNGKTTVTSMVGLLCARAGLSVRVAGNISPAALDVLRQCVLDDSLPQAWVLELSSFQLQTTFSLAADAATILNLTQDHLDWHGSMAAYAAAKARIFAPYTVRVVNRDDAQVMALAHHNIAQIEVLAKVKKAPPVAVAAVVVESDADAATPASSDAAPLADDAPFVPPPLPEAVLLPPAIISFGTDEPQTPDAFGLQSERGMQWLVQAVAQEDGEKKRRRKGAVEVVAVAINRLMPQDALKIRGQHNATNALAALALCRAIGLPLAPLLHGVREYQGEPHRVEWLQSIGGVDYFDDSKGTNVGATVAAIKGLGAAFGGSAQKLVLIAGGDGKGQDFTPLQEPVSRHVRAVCLIGRDGPQIRATLAQCGVDLLDCATLEQAVQEAARLAHSGDAVLLSPACASLDMFRNYAHRAEVFVAQVRELALACGEIA